MQSMITIIGQVQNLVYFESYHMSHIIWTCISFIMCCLAQTSANESNHARLITRGLHHKGSLLLNICISNWNLNFTGVPICVTSNHYESMTSLCPIMQNIGFGGNDRINLVLRLVFKLSIFEQFQLIFENFRSE